MIRPQEALYLYPIDETARNSVLRRRTVTVPVNKYRTCTQALTTVSYIDPHEDILCQVISNPLFVVSEKHELIKQSESWTM